MIQCKAVLEFFQKLHLQIYSTSICPFESGKCGIEGKKSPKLEYLEHEKHFSDEIKSIFHSF